MAYSQTQLDALEQAIAQGVLTVKRGDRLITYRSLEEMERTRDQMKAELGQNTGKVTRRFASMSKGL